MKFPAMFSPIRIGTVTVPNRFVVPPMGNNFANTDGSLSDRSLGYYQARAKGGFGLITIESTVEDPENELRDWAPGLRVSQRGYMLGYHDLKDPGVSGFFRFLSKVGEGKMKMRIVRLDFGKGGKNE